MPLCPDGPGLTDRPPTEPIRYMVDNFTPEEEGNLERRAGDPDPPACPRCGSPMVRRRVSPRKDVSYVRRRILLVCSGCGRSAAVDVTRRAPEGERPDGD